jgi:hypothetical protein
MLADVMPRAGAALRLLLLREPMVRLVLRGLREASGLREQEGEATLARLARACDRIDHDRAPLLFFTPGRLTGILGPKGRIEWDAAEGPYYRSTTFLQMKRILQHAGLLADTGVHASRSRDCQPERDVWRLW